MEVTEFTEDARQRLVRNLEGHWAFVPPPLPGHLQWSNAVGQALSAADRALGRLVGIAQNLRDPKRLLLRSFLRREAEFSSRIEGTHATFKDLVLFEQTQSAERHAPDVREVNNNYQALSFGLESVSEHKRRISVSLLREMHAMLLRNVRGHDHTPGRFRKVQAHIGNSNRIEEARFVPPPPHLVLPAMEELEAFISKPTDLPPLARVAMIHYQFEAIHPFADGNGRIGRILILLLLCADGILPVPLLNPSAFLESNRREYYDELLSVSQRGAWTQWITFFAGAVGSEATEAAQRINRLRELEVRYYTRFQTARSSALLLKLIDELFVTPAITLRQASRVLGVSPTSAQNNIDKLIAAGILVEITEQQRNRVYIAREIQRAVAGKVASTQRKHDAGK